MPNKELLVFINGEEAGSLIQRETGRLSFIYNEAWRNTIDSFPISLSMPLTQKQYDAGPVENYVWTTNAPPLLAANSCSNVKFKDQV